MTIAAGAYLTIIRLNQQAQAIATGIDNVSFALESMTRNIRSGSDYGCPTQGTDCYPIPGTTFEFKDVYGDTITYSCSDCGQPGGGVIQESTDGGITWINITDPSVNITSLKFYVSGTQPYNPPTSIDILQPYVTIVVSGTVPAGPGQTRSFTVESSAAWRGSNI
jgi:hypothetical protein